MRPSDIGDIVEASDPRVSPDGQAVAYVVTTADVAANKYRSSIWVAGVDRDLPPLPFTAGDGRDNRPRWSPDGTLLAWVAHPEPKGASLVVADVEGAEPVV